MTDWHLLALDGESRALADAARAQFGSLDGPAATRRALDGEKLHGDRWAALVDGGYLDIGVPEHLDGIGRLIDLVVVLDEAARALLTPSPLPTVLAIQAQVAAGVHRPEGRHAPAGFATATGRVENGRCHVERTHVLGDGATVTLVVDDGERIRVAVVDAYADGVEPLGDRTLVDPSRPLVPYRFSGAPCLAVGAVDGFPAAVRVCVAADLLGTATGALDAAVAHVKQRRQFGQLIGSFQAVKHQLADALVATERARSLTYGAALTPVSPHLPLLANAAAAETAVTTAARYVQLMGAMGVTFDADCHLYLRRAHQGAALLGAPDDLFAAAAATVRSGRFAGVGDG